MPEENEKKGNEKEANEESTAQGGGSSKALLFGIIGGVVVVNALVAFLLIQLLKPPNPAKEEAKMRADSLKQAISELTSIGSISDPPIEVVVNIPGTDGLRFLKVIVVLEYDDKLYKTIGDELTLRHAKLKNMLIEQLSTMTLEEVEDPGARTRIRKEFMRAVNKTLPDKAGQISNVYINEFITQ